ncbi:hypothetical protein [Clostridium sp.]|uniref:hypothetical protein n=1 Tax=Clostridium sp. TaxID=1506 RepID=UPI001A61BB26|nr:hypothetical protein [Clostridium sp.]MBK5234088.1 hypothetical protein [Clostridium sp.]
MGSNNQKRTFKFYRKNEIEVMESLGMKGTINSGSGWIEKEDGQNDFVICQLKSTDATSIKISQKDIRILEYNARVTHKVPMFAIQFLNVDETFIIMKPSDIEAINEYINTGGIENIDMGLDLSSEDSTSVTVTKKIGGASSSRSKFYSEKNKKFDKTTKANGDLFK